MNTYEDLDTRLYQYTRDYLMKPHWILDNTFDTLAERMFNLGESVWSEIDQHVYPLSRLAPESIKICDNPHDLKNHVTQWTSLRMLDFSNNEFKGRRAPLLDYIRTIPPTLTFLSLLFYHQKEARSLMNSIAHQTNLEILRLEMYNVQWDLCPTFQNLTNLQTLFLRTAMNTLPPLPLLETLVWESVANFETMGVPELFKLDWSTHFPSLKRFGMTGTCFGEWSEQIASILPTQLTSLHLPFPPPLETDGFLTKLNQMTNLTDLNLGDFWQNITIEDQLACVPFWPLMRLNPFEDIIIDMTLILPEVAIPLMSQCGHLQDQCWSVDPKWTPGEVERLCQPLTNLTSLQFCIDQEGDVDFIVAALHCLSTQLLSIVIDAPQYSDQAPVEPLCKVYQLVFPVLERFEVAVIDEHAPACMEFLHRHTTLRHLTLYMDMCVQSYWDLHKLALESLELLRWRNDRFPIRFPHTLHVIKAGISFTEELFDWEQFLCLQVLDDYMDSDYKLAPLLRNRIRNVTLESLAVFEPTYVRNERNSIFRPTCGSWIERN